MPDRNNHNGLDDGRSPHSPLKYLVSTHVPQSLSPSSDISDLCSFDCLSIMGTGGRERGKEREREIRNDRRRVIIGRRNNVLIDRPSEIAQEEEKAFAFSSHFPRFVSHQSHEKGPFPLPVYFVTKTGPNEPLKWIVLENFIRVLI